MNPARFSQMMKYLTRAKKEKPDLPDVFPASKAPIPPKTQNVEEIEAINAFIRRERQQKAGGGMLVQPSADGSRPGYANEKKLNKTMEKRISNYESKTGNNYEDQPSWRKKDIRDGNWTGGGKGEKFKDPAFIKQKSEGTQIQKVRNYLSSAIRENKGKPVTFKTISEIKKGAGVTANIDADITRVLQSNKFTNKINLRNFEKLPDEVIKEIKSSFSNLVPKNKWNFDKHKFGINKTDIDVRVYDRIRRSVEDPKPTRYGFQFANPDGWMLTQMDRAYRSGNKSYKPLYAVVNGVRKVVGYVDNTDKGAGKKYFASEIYIKGKNSDGVLIKGTNKTLPHPDYAENVKYHNIVMKSGQPPNKAIRDILTKGGIAGSEKIQMRHVLNFILDNGDYNAARNSIVRHHRGQLNNATSDLQILNRVQNVKVTGIEDRISQGNILPEDVAKLKNFGVSVRGPDGTLYGGGPRTAAGGLRDINKLILEGSKNVDLYGKEIKGLKDFTKADFDKFKLQLASLGGGDCGRIRKYQGGRIGLQDGTSNVDVCFRNATNRINSGFKNATLAEARNYTKLLNAVKGSAVIGKNLLKFGIVPEALYVGADTLVRMGYGDTFKEAGLRAADFFMPGDQMQEADKLKVQRTLGDAAATNVGRVFDYRNQIANIDSLEQQKQNFENLSGGGAFDYVGDLSQDVKNIDTRLNQAKNNLQNKFMVSEAETVAADRALEEAYDISKAKSPLARLKSFAQNIEAVQDDPFLSDIASPQKTQMDLNLNMFPPMQTDFMKMKDSDIINRRRQLTDMGVQDLPSSRELMADRDKEIADMKSRSLLDFGREQAFGTQGTFFGQPLAGGGIAKMAGVSSGPAPVRGPNSQGLLSLKNRVRNY